MSRTILIFSISLAVLLGLLKWMEYQFYARTFSLEVYLGAVGLFCTVLGGWIGWKLTRPSQKAQEAVSENVRVSIGFDPENSFGLSPREYEVLVHIANGLSYQEIADQLYVSLNTVKTHAANIFSKMDVQRRTQAVMLAQKSGLLPPAKV